jgi:hypothetical protein
MASLFDHFVGSADKRCNPCPVFGAASSRDDRPSSPRARGAASSQGPPLLAAYSGVAAAPQRGVVKCGLALQLHFLEVSESMGNHDSKIVDAGSID